MNKMAMHEAMTTAISTRIQDPAQWMVEVRRICEALKLDVTRAISLSGTLDTVCMYLLGEADKHGRTEAQILAAIG